MSRAGGCAVVVVAVALPTGALFTAAPDAGVVGAWAVGTGALWWVIHREKLLDTPQDREPLPHRESERGSEDEEAGHSFTVVEDRPGHHRVVWDDKEDDES